MREVLEISFENCILGKRLLHAYLGIGITPSLFFGESWCTDRLGVLVCIEVVAVQRYYADKIIFQKDSKNKIKGRCGAVHLDVGAINLLL